MISHSVHTIYGYVLPFIMLSDQINGLLATLSSKQEGKDPALAKSPALNEEAKSMKHVKIKKAMKKVKRRADVLKKVMELRLATAA